MGSKWLEQSEEDPLVYHTGHRDDRNSPKCIIGNVQIIKDGNNFCLSCLEQQRLVALLQGSVESDDSPASGGDEEEWEQGQADNFSEPIRFEAGRSRSGRPTTTRYVLRQSTMVIKPGKAINGLDTKKLLNSRTFGFIYFFTSCKAGILLLVIDRDPLCNIHRVKEEIHIRLQHQQG